MLDNVIDQVEQAGLDVLIHPRGDQAGGQSQRALPRADAMPPPARPPWRASLDLRVRRRQRDPLSG
ncbi:MAG: hypothetical protein M3325_10995 [Actinomycetota bacterium]|nr:hypothetical protein [Actinomycetota bacterium]